MRAGCRDCQHPAANGSLVPPPPLGQYCSRPSLVSAHTIQWAASSGTFEGGFQASPEGFPASSLGAAPQDFLPLAYPLQQGPNLSTGGSALNARFGLAGQERSLYCTLESSLRFRGCWGRAPKEFPPLWDPDLTGGEATLAGSRCGTWESSLYDRTVNLEPRGNHLVPGTPPEQQPCCSRFLCVTDR